MDTKNTRIVEGRLAIASRGLGFVRTPDLEDAVVIEPRFLDLALNGDIVKVSLHPKIKNKDQSGEIIEIVKRKKKGFSGTLVERDGSYFLEPQDHRDNFEILIPEDKLGGAKPKQKVFGVITKWTERKKVPLGEIQEVLGSEGENNAEMRAIALEKGFSQDFPRAVLEEAQVISERGITEKDHRDRKDMRGITTFTIDPADAKDFDDALSFEFLDNGNYKIGIHIADVSFYVKPGTELDKEAYDRATSVYLVDRTIPMLPEELSNDLCSLKPNVDRLAFSAVFELDPNADVKNTWFGRTIIHSDKRFVYEEAQEVIDGEGPHKKELEILVDLSKKFAQKRFEAGAISLETDEVKFKLNEEGVPVSVYVKERGDTHRMIEEFMLLANRHVAKYLSADEEKNERLAIYRIHDKPSPDRTEDLVKFLNILGFEAKTNKEGVVPGSEINRIAEEADKDDMGATVQTAIVRSMAKAIYSIKNIGHYGLAFDYYTHFTSPIRRYPDVIVHRLLQTYLDGQSIPKQKWPRYQTTCDHSSEREKEAADAERDSVKYKQVEYMSEHVGEEFTGVITGISEMGIFVAELETRSEGLIRMRDIGEEYFKYDDKEMAIIGTKTKVKYRMGDHAPIRVKKVDLERKLIDYEFITKNITKDARKTS